MMDREQVWVGGSEEAWSDFLASATDEEVQDAYVALLEAVPGPRGEALRHIFKLHGRSGVRRVLQLSGDVA